MNADCILIMGSNAAEHHPIAFKWILRAKEKGATIIHVDPRYTRTSARCDFHVPLRSGTDIAFLGGMINYILENDKIFRDYVANYTNASFIVGADFEFKDGLFSGYDARKRKYDKATWELEKDSQGIPKRDMTLTHPRCVLQMLRKHYSRYTLDKVSSITGVSKENLLKVYEAYSATGKPDKAGTECYALGWTHHTSGSQNIRTMAIIQLLLGNMGIAGGGINALRGEPNVQGSTDHCILYGNLPGYLKMPVASLTTLEKYNHKYTPVSKDPQSANYYSNIRSSLIVF
jgi:formate dehydrogenase major subunit